MNPLSKPVDYILLAGLKSPGIAELPNGANSPRKWDVRKGYGLSGSGVVYVGDDLAKFSVKILLLTDEDWSAWTSFRALLVKPPNNVKPKSLAIWHPILEEHGVASVVVEDLVGPTQTMDGGWTWEIKFLQFRAPKAAIAKPAGSTQKPKQEPESEADRIIKSLTGQVQELSR